MLLCCRLQANLLRCSRTLEQDFADILHRCARYADIRLVFSVHATIVKVSQLSSSQFLQNHLLNAYFKCCNEPSFALQLFDEMPHRNVVSWSASIAGLVQLNHSHDALELFRTMQNAGVRPNEFTLVSTLNASSFTEGAASARQIYCLVIKLGFESNVFLVNAFLTALIRNGRLIDAAEMFEKCSERDVVSWNAMLAGYLQCSFSEVWEFWCRMIKEGMRPDEFSFSTIFTGLAACLRLRNGVQVHAQLVKYGLGGDTCVGNSLVDLYLKNKAVEDGFRAFDELPYRDVVSWTQMASSCLLSGQPFKALAFIQRMKLGGIRPNKFTLATAFNACSSLSSLEEGKKAHGFRIKLGVDVDVCVDNALIDMYAKCGSTDAAWRIFYLMKERSVISWTTMIMAFAHNGFAQEALNLFDDMVSQRVEPNFITFICVLYACSQGGFVDQGWKYFRSMLKDYSIEPGEDHYACMVYLLGKAGRIVEAEDLIRSMPFQPRVILWQTLLGSCQVHDDLGTAKKAAENALAMEKKDPLTYVLLSNMFAHSRNWDAVGRVRELMKNWEVNKEPGSSWIETMRDGNYPMRPQAAASF